jgi:hypothetical protein
MTRIEATNLPGAMLSLPIAEAEVLLQIKQACVKAANGGSFHLHRRPRHISHYPGGMRSPGKKCDRIKDRFLSGRRRRPRGASCEQQPSDANNLGESAHQQEFENGRGGRCSDVAFIERAGRIMPEA